MIKRLFVLILVIGIGIVAFQNIDISTSWQKAQAFVEDNLDKSVLKDIKEGRLKGKEEGLENKLKKLSHDLLIKAKEGTDKYKEIESAVLQTKQALEITKAAISNLQNSAKKSATVLGIREDDGTTGSSSTSSNTTNTYYQTIIKTVPSTEIKAFCEQWAQ